MIKGELKMSYEKIKFDLTKDEYHTLMFLCKKQMKECCSDKPRRKYKKLLVKLAFNYSYLNRMDHYFDDKKEMAKNESGAKKEN